MPASVTRDWRGSGLEVVLDPRSQHWRTLISLDSRSSDLPCLEERWWRPSIFRRTSFPTVVFHGSWPPWLSRSWPWMASQPREYSGYPQILTRWWVWRLVTINGSREPVVMLMCQRLCSNNGYENSIFLLYLVSCCKNKTCWSIDANNATRTKAILISASNGLIMLQLDSCLLPKRASSGRISSNSLLRPILCLHFYKLSIILISL